MKIIPRFASSLALTLFVAATVSAQTTLSGPLTITGGTWSGNQYITGTEDIAGNTLIFGTDGSDNGVWWEYTPGSGTGSLNNLLSQSSGAWTWSRGLLPSSSVAAMKVDGNNQLILYNKTTSQPGVTLIPASASVQLGSSATLSIDGSNNLMTSGAFRIGGASGALLTASGANLSLGGALTVANGVTNTNGSFTGGSTGLALFAGGTNQNITLNSSGTGDIIFNAGGAERARIKAAGNIGIGATNPGAKLHISGGDFWMHDANGSSGNKLAFSYAGSSGLATIGPNSTGGSTAISWGTSISGTYAEKMRIDYAGNVGIGTSSPAAKLHIWSPQLAGTQGATVQLLRLENPNGNGSLLKIFQRRYAAGGDWHTASTRFQLQTDIVDGAYMEFNAPNGTGGGLAFGDGSYEYLRLAPGGNVGVGTTNPGARLDVAGNLLLSGNRSTILTTGDDTNSLRGGIQLVSYNYGANQVWTPTDGGGVPQNGTIAFGGFGSYNSNTVNLAVSGNVAIGTYTSGYRLAVNGAIRAKEIVVDTGWADYVFDESYRLAPLSEVEAHIKSEKHLPGVPSAAEVAEHGVSMGQMQATLLSKIEELTLHLIQMEKENAALRERVQKLETTSRQ